MIILILGAKLDDLRAQERKVKHHNAKIAKAADGNSSRFRCSVMKGDSSVMVGDERLELPTSSV